MGEYISPSCYEVKAERTLNLMACTPVLFPLVMLIVDEALEKVPGSRMPYKQNACHVYPAAGLFYALVPQSISFPFHSIPLPYPFSRVTTFLVMVFLDFPS